jgi:uncharacterized protein YdbL (DUF1318 family)
MNRFTTLGLLAGALALTGASVAVAQTSAKAQVDAAKARGVVGEQADGFLGFVSGDGDGALQAAVREINAGRAEVYREAAQRTGATPAAAGQAAFQQIQGRLPSGQYYRPLNGGWTRK